MKPAHEQFLRFSIVGIANTLVDWGILNLLILTFSHAAVFSYPLFKTISFSIAVLNSYFLNKTWVFPTSEQKNKAVQLPKFIAISTIGMGFNVGTASAFVSTSACGAYFVLCANIGAVLGTLAAFLWNYFGYKLFVFRS